MIAVQTGENGYGRYDTYKAREAGKRISNGVAIQGRYGIPCVGFGPGAESQAHAPNEITYKDDLVRCAAVYVAAANLYNEDNKTDDVSQFRAGKTNNDIK